MAQASSQKNQNKPASASNVATLPSASAPPEGMQRVANDVNAFWMPTKGPIHGRLLGAKDTRNKRGKIVRIYMIELSSPCEVKGKLENGEVTEFQADKGETIGIWGSAGLKDLDMLGGAIVWVNRTKKKPLGNEQYMWLFDIRMSGVAKPLRVRQVREEAPEDPEGDQDETPF